MKQPGCVGILAATAVVLGCADGDPTGAAGNLREGNRVGALEVSVRLSAGRFATAEGLQVTVRGENVSSRVLFPEVGPCVLTFDVLNADDEVVTTGPCPMALWDGRLDPGDAYEFTFTWHGETGGADGEVLPAGTYHVRGILDLASGPARSGAVPVELTRSSP
jgi:hypothetical protein